MEQALSEQSNIDDVSKAKQWKESREWSNQEEKSIYGNDYVLKGD